MDNMNDLLNEIIKLLKRYGLDCMKYAPPSYPSIRCMASEWSGPWAILIEIMKK